MSIVLVGSSSGSITLQEPAVAGTTTLNLPATSGTVVVTGTTPTLNGITFPATQVPSADANTLDDYEEGTFTATLSDGTNSVNLGGLCVYTKVGRVVTVGVFGYNQNFSSLSASAQLRIGGLPFTPSTAIACSFNTHNTSTVTLVVSINSGDSNAYISQMNSTIDATAATRNNIVSGAGTFSVRGSFTYFAS